MWNVGAKKWVRTLAALGVCSASACALSSDPKIRVSMPGSSSQVGLNFASNLSIGAPPPPPAAFSGFTCFGLNVTGSGVPRAPFCQGDPAAGKLGGLAPFSGGTIDIRVPPGSARKVELLGVMSPTASCPFIGGTEDPNVELGAYKIGETTVDLFEDKSVTIQAAYDPMAPIPALTGCGPSGPTPWPGPMQMPVQPLAWYQANGNPWTDMQTVTLWPDHSGNGRSLNSSGATFVMNDPRLNGNRAVRTLGTVGTVFSRNVADPGLDSLTSLTVVAVVSANAYGSTFTPLANMKFTSLQFGVTFGPLSSYFPTVKTGTSYSTPDTVNAPPTDVPLIIVGKTTGVFADLYVNGRWAANSNTAGMGIGGVFTEINVGMDGSTYGFNSYGDVIFYPTALSDSDREGLECNLRYKYGIPVTHTIHQCP